MKKLLTIAVVIAAMLFSQSLAQAHNRVGHANFNGSRSYNTGFGYGSGYGYNSGFSYPIAISTYPVVTSFSYALPTLAIPVATYAAALPVVQAPVVATAPIVTQVPAPILVADPVPVVSYPYTTTFFSSINYGTSYGSGYGYGGVNNVGSGTYFNGTRNFNTIHHANHGNHHRR